jgi:hypothetical protein
MKNDINILIPFRGRQAHLDILLPVLEKSSSFLGLDFNIFVVKQTYSQRFNKGALYNAGFLEASKISDCEYWVFHDVDVIEKTPGTFKYSRTDGTSSIYCTVGTNPGGGIFCINSESFKKINGYSNGYIYWGREDQDFRKRILLNEIKILNSENTIFRLSEERKSLVKEFGTPDGERVHYSPPAQIQLFRKNMKKYNKNPSSIMEDGLNNVKYNFKKYFKKDKINYLVIDIHKQ